MHVCRESRAEGMRVYIMVKFDVLEDKTKERWIYYNPDADILHFGPNACFETIVRISQLGLRIPRVAIYQTLLNYQSQTCGTEETHPGLRIHLFFLRRGLDASLGALHGTTRRDPASVKA